MTETVPIKKIDKSTWPQGPWHDEPDRLQWQHAGYACLIVRVPHSGHLCGYVGVDSSHPYFGKEYGECNVDVHGGLTYSDKCQGSICHIPEPGMPDEVWWLGFDCAHLGDACPCYDYRRIGPMDHYRSVEYVKRETESLARQLREIATKASYAH